MHPRHHFTLLLSFVALAIPLFTARQPLAASSRLSRGFLGDAAIPPDGTRILDLREFALSEFLIINLLFLPSSFLVLFSLPEIVIDRSITNRSIYCTLGRIIGNPRVTFFFRTKQTNRDSKPRELYRRNREKILSYIRYGMSIDHGEKSGGRSHSRISQIIERAVDNFQVRCFPDFVFVIREFPFFR